MAKLTIAVGVLAVALAGWAVNRYWLTAPSRFDQPRIVSVAPGDSMRAVAHRLQDAGVVRSAIAMAAYAEWTGSARRILPGDYAFGGGERIPDVMRHLVNGDSTGVTVTIPEGLTVHQIAERLEAAGLVCDYDFERATRTSDVVGALGLGPLGAEGYLFPATYRFSRRATARDILVAMLGRFFRIFTPAVEQRRFEVGLDLRELVTLASIVEKEAKVAGERPLVAGVFYNRLRLNMPLQSDPTAQYSFGGEIHPALTAVHTPSNFNTYSFVGLPPGPIANPGLRSIQAALYPARTDYLYFVARDDGTHLFSRSLIDHERAIAEIKRDGARRESAKAQDALRERRQ